MMFQFTRWLTQIVPLHKIWPQSAFFSQNNPWVGTSIYKPGKPYQNATVMELLSSEPEIFKCLLKNKEIFSYALERQERNKNYAFKALGVLTFGMVTPLILKTVITQEPYTLYLTLYFWVGILAYGGFALHHLYKVSQVSFLPHRKAIHCVDNFNTCLEEVKTYLAAQRKDHPHMSYLIGQQISLQRKMWILERAQASDKTTLYMWEKLSEFLEEYEIIKIQHTLRQNKNLSLRENVVEKHFASKEENDIFIEREQLSKQIGETIVAMPAQAIQVNGKKKTHKI